MIVVAGHLLVDPADRDRFVADSAAHVRAARAAPGCLDFAVSADPLQDDRVNVCERWASRAALTAFRGDGIDDASAQRIRAFHVDEFPAARPGGSPSRVVAYLGGDADQAVTRAFLVDLLGFDVAMEVPYLAVVAPDNPSAQVLVTPTEAGIPAAAFGVDLGSPERVDAAHAAARERGLEVVYDLRTEPWGVRRFFVAAPGGTVVNVLAHLTG